MNIYGACLVFGVFWFILSCFCKGKLTGDDKEDTNNED